jgi:hypothetical protein
MAPATPIPPFIAPNRRGTALFQRVTLPAFDRSAVDILFSLPLYRTTTIWRDEYVRKSDLN